MSADEAFAVAFTATATKDIERLPQASALAALDVAESLKKSPLSGKPLVGSLRACRSVRFHAGSSYRLAYLIQAAERT